MLTDDDVNKQKMVSKENMWILTFYNCMKEKTKQNEVLFLSKMYYIELFFSVSIRGIIEKLPSIVRTENVMIKNSTLKKDGYF